MKALGLLVVAGCVQQDIPVLPAPSISLAFVPIAPVVMTDRMIVRGQNGEVAELGPTGQQVPPLLVSGSYEHVGANAGMVGWVRDTQEQRILGKRLPDGSLVELPQPMNLFPIGVVAAPDEVFVDFGSGNIEAITTTGFKPLAFPIPFNFTLTDASATHLYGFESNQVGARITRYSRQQGTLETLVDFPRTGDDIVLRFTVRGDRLVYGLSDGTVHERELKPGVDRVLGDMPLNCTFLCELAASETEAFYGQYRYVDGDVAWFLASENDLDLARPLGVVDGQVLWSIGTRIYTRGASEPEP